MPLIQVRDVPEHIYRLLAEQARLQRRSLSQQAVTVLARGLEVETDAKARRRAVLDEIRSTPSEHFAGLPDPVKLIREDRQR